MIKKLADLHLNEAGIISSLNCGKNATQRLLDMGMTPGTDITVIKKGMFFGPVGVKLRNSCVVIGHSLSSKILVETNGKT